MAVRTVPRRAHGVNAFAGIRTAVIGLTRAAVLTLPSVAGAPLRTLSGHLHDDVPETEGSNLVVLYVASIILVLLGGAFAGLTIA